MVSVRVATIARSAAVAVERFARVSTVSWLGAAKELEASTALALGKCCPAVRRRLAFHSRCAFAKNVLNAFQVLSTADLLFQSLISSWNTLVLATQRRAVSTICSGVKALSPSSANAAPSEI